MPAPIAVGRFNHATLNCRDVRRSVAFYREVLGFHEVRRPAFPFAGAWLYREGLGVMVHLNEDPHLAPPSERIETRRWHLAFRVASYDEAVSGLQARGLNYVERTLPEHGFRQVFIHDPDGNIIELTEIPDAEEMAERVGGVEG